MIQQSLAGDEDWHHSQEKAVLQHRSSAAPLFVTMNSTTVNVVHMQRIHLCYSFLAVFKNKCEDNSDATLGTDRHREVSEAVCWLKKAEKD